MRELFLENMKQCDYKVDNKMRVGMREMEIRGCARKNDKGGRFTKHSDTANACENATEVASSPGREGIAQCTIATKVQYKYTNMQSSTPTNTRKNEKLIPICDKNILLATREVKRPPWVCVTYGSNAIVVDSVTPLACLFSVNIVDMY